MSAKKIKDEGSASAFGALFMGILSAMFGALLGVLYMASFPASAFNSVREFDSFMEAKAERQDRPGDAYFMKGQNLQTREWEAKRQALIDGEAGSVVDLADRELNAWFSSKFKVGKPPKSEGLPNLTILPSVPNIYFGDEIVYVSLPVEISLFGKSYDHTIFITGTFSDDGELKLQIESLNLDSAGMPFLDQVGSTFVNRILQAYSATEEYGVFQKICGRVESVEQSEGKLHLTLR